MEILVVYKQLGSSFKWTCISLTMNPTINWLIVIGYEELDLCLRYVKINS
jgi:hypothetical protein